MNALPALSSLDAVPLLSVVMICLGALTIASLLSGIAAPYGRYAASASWLYGFHIPASAAWIIQELPSFAVVAALWASAAAGNGPLKAELTSANPRTVLLALFLCHYANRTFIYPLRIRNGKPTPAVICAMAFCFCVYNGYIQGRWLTESAAAPAPSVWHPRFLLGVAIFVCGLAINWHSDGILIGLRPPGDAGYYIPRGGMFELVSGANFFGEILEWCGFAIAAWSLPAAAFAIFTFCNTAPRGYSHHLWYLKRFKDYPRMRKAVIPFLW